MKKNIIIILACILTTCHFSCKSKKDKTTAEEIYEFRCQLTHEDSLAMIKLCDDAMELLKNKKFEQVLASLYEYDDSTKEVKPLSELTKKKYLKTFELFPVLEYRRKYFSFMLEGCNDVKYEVVFATADQAGTPEPPKTAYMWNPVKIDGTWKLCVKTEHDKVDNKFR